MRTIGCSIAALALLAAGSSFAAHPLVSDDSATIEKRMIQVELNGDIGTDKESPEGESTKYTSSQVASTVGYGITDKIDVVIGYAHPWGESDVDGVTSKDRGSSDYGLEVKWKVYEQEDFSVALKPQFSYSYALEVPNKDYTVSYGTILILSRDIEPLAFHLNIGYAYNDYSQAEIRETSRRNIWSVSLATTYEIIENLQAVADFGTSTNEDKDSKEMPVFALAGLIYSVNQHLDVSTGLKLGLTNPETDLAGTLGLTLIF